jgi:ArsR family transcriptional regulator, arsenate/arsenite/antimonite-responsive transcriptional repressor
MGVEYAVSMAITELPVRRRGECCAIPLPVDGERAKHVADLCRALADPTRLSIMACLWQATEPVCICDLTATYDLSQPTISHHVAKLKQAGLVESHKAGVWVYYELRRELSAETRTTLGALLG